MKRTLRTAFKTAGSALDQAILGVLSRNLRQVPTQPLAEDARQKLGGLTEHYGRANLFVPPQAAVIKLEPVRKAVTDLWFSSAYRPTYSSYIDEHQSYLANLTAHARLLAASPERLGPTAILIHGWQAGSYLGFRHMLPVTLLRRLGWDVVMFQLPFHGRRAPLQSPASGSLFPSTHIVRTNETFGQVISDLRQLRGWLRGRGAPVVGVMGMSLGGYVSALWASLDDDLAFAVPIVPGVNIAAFMWQHGHRSRTRRLSEQRGITRAMVEQAFACHSPLHHHPKLAQERLMIIAGEGDRIAPPDQAELLWQHWNKPRIHWFPGGHVLQLGRSEAYQGLSDFLKPLSLGGHPSGEGP